MAKLFTPFDSSRRADHFDVVGCQNRIKIGWVMLIQSWGKSGELANFGLQIGYFGNIYWDMDFKFVLPINYANVKVQTQWEVNFIQIDYLRPQKP